MRQAVARATALLQECCAVCKVTGQAIQLEVATGVLEALLRGEADQVIASMKAAAGVQ